MADREPVDGVGEMYTLSRTTDERRFVIRVGADLVSVHDVASSIEQFGDRYLGRVYSSAELRTCSAADGLPLANRLAARFAAKEATIKALRPSVGLAYSNIEVITAPSGAPAMAVSGAAAEWVDELDLSSSSVSLTHEGDFAAAIFVAIIADDSHREHRRRRRRTQ
jgi:holo-[acyl-carrier protein] synthase